MKVTFCCDSGANIHSRRKETVDTVADLGMEEGEWEALPDEEKQKIVEEWAWERLEIYWKD
jgi:hypothetical protein